MMRQQRGRPRTMAARFQVAPPPVLTVWMLLFGSRRRTIGGATSILLQMIHTHLATSGKLFMAAPNRGCVVRRDGASVIAVHSVAAPWLAHPE